MSDRRPAVSAILFDVGGPLDSEVRHEQLIDRDIRAALAAEGYTADDTAYVAACQRAVASFAPDAYAAIIWTLTGRDVNAAGRAHDRLLAGAAVRTVERGGLELRPGIGALLARLHDRGLLLGLAANQPAETVKRLRALGIGRLFHHQQVSGTHGFRKPDVRLFLTACANLGVRPEQCMMVGDRIDNDIAPARLLGMRTVRFRSGRHAAQEPRSAAERPDAEVSSVAALATAIDQLLA